MGEDSEDEGTERKTSRPVKTRGELGMEVSLTQQTEQYIFIVSFTYMYGVY